MPRALGSLETAVSGSQLPLPIQAASEVEAALEKLLSAALSSDAVKYPCLSTNQSQHPPQAGLREEESPLGSAG